MLPFRKFHAAGNDFLVLEGSPDSLSDAQRRCLCDRHTGIGADGIVAIQPWIMQFRAEVPLEHGELFVPMHYWNADGKKGSFCGNGARVAMWLVYEQYRKAQATLVAADGEHKAEIVSLSPPRVAVQLTLRKPVQQVSSSQWFVDSGSPHLLIQVPTKELWTWPLALQAPTLRAETTYDPGGMNVSIFAPLEGGLWGLRTYERGVEAETLSCGTACVALAALLQKYPERFHHLETSLSIHTRGGQLEVREEGRDFWLIGPVEEVFQGRWVAPL